MTALLDGLAGRRVAVLGDLVADEFVHGEISRVSREAPVLILEHDHTVVVPGGAGNAVENLRALDGRPLPVGVVGKDPAGTGILERFEAGGIPTAGIVVDPDWATPTKSRILAGGVHTRRQQVVRVDRGARHGALPRPVLDRIAARLGRLLARADGLLVADYGYGAAPPAVARGGLRWKGLPVTVDSRGRVKEFRGAAACTPNQEEVERALDLPPLRRTRDLEQAGARLLAETGNRAVLVTRGAMGMALFERDRKPVHVPAWGSGEVADVTGAGDTVIAAFTLALLAGGTFQEAAQLANVAAGLVVLKYGTATVTRAELAASLAAGAR